MVPPNRPKAAPKPKPPLFSIEKTLKKTPNEFRYPRPPSKSTKKKPSLLSNVRTAGAFRVIAVTPLLVDPPKEPQIELHEWQDIIYKPNRNRTQMNALNNTMRGIKYAAISHIWENSFEVDNAFEDAKDQTDRIKVITKEIDEDTEPESKAISWRGLIQAARAAHYKKADYFWLDFLCLDQLGGDDNEKELQIALMASIYRNACSVIIMISGVVAVGDISDQTGWIDRAWTLQESLVNYKQGDETYVYVKLPKKLATTFRGHDGNDINFEKVEGDDCLLTFRDAFNLADTELSQHFEPKATKPVYATILNGRVKNSGEVPRRVLFAALFANGTAPKRATKMGRDRARNTARNTAIWRSMFLRQSSNEVDIVYSLMGCLGLEIDPFRNARTPTFLFNDLARKAAVSPLVGPLWLVTAGVNGSRIPQHNHSRLIPQFPHTEPNEASTFIVKNGKIPVAKYIDTSANYINTYDITFVTQSHPHIISAMMLKIQSFKPDAVKKGKNGKTSKKSSGRASMTLRTSSGPVDGICYYHSMSLEQIYQYVYAVYVGDVENMGIPNVPASRVGYKYFLFLHWDPEKLQWNVIGDGSFRRSKGTLTLREQRWLFTMGEGSQQSEPRWKEDNTVPKLKAWLNKKISVDANDRKKAFQYHHYGFTPLNNINTKGAGTTNLRITWVGRQVLHQHDK